MIIYGESEHAEGNVGVKDLSTGEQETVRIDELTKYLGGARVI